MASIYEVAAHADVSPATVSRVIDGAPVRPELEMRVREAMTALDDRPSRQGLSLPTKRYQMIALVIPDIENPFFTSLARGAEQVTREAGYSLMLCNTDGDPVHERSYVQVIQAGSIFGAIVTPFAAGEAFLPLLDEGRPLVAVDRHVWDPRADAVMTDNRAGAVEATEWHFDQGRTQIACITGQPNVETARERAQGWREAMDRRVGVREEYLVWTDFRHTGGALATEQLLDLDHPPEGIMAANNMIAIGVLTTLTRRGLTLDDVALSVCDALPYPISPQPGLHTVPTPARAIGEHAARILLARLAGDMSPPRTIVLDSKGRVISDDTVIPPEPAD